MKLSAGRIWMIMACAFCCARAGFAASQSFSYQPTCLFSDSAVYPHTSPGFPGGGTFSASPGVTVHPVNGAVSLFGVSPGTYTITYFGYTCACDTPAPLFATILIRHGSPLVVDGATVCAGSSATLTATQAAAISYSWSTGAQGQQVVVTPDSTSAFNVTVTDSSGCRYNASATVSVIQHYTLSVSGNFTLCSHDTAFLAATGAPSFTWSTGDTSRQLTLYPPAPATFTVWAGRYGCLSSFTLALDVRPSPSLTAQQFTTCAGTPVTVSVTAFPSTVQVAWMPGGQQSKTISVSPHTEQTYTAAASQNGCIVLLPVKVNVIPVSAAHTTFVYKSPVCKSYGTLAPEKENLFSEGGIYSSAGGLVLTANTGEIDLPQSAAGEYTVSYMVPKTGCTEAGTGTTTVAVRENPRLDLPKQVQLIAGEEITLDAGEATTYSWSPPGHLSCIHCRDPRAAPVRSTVYCVTAMIDNCEVTECIDVQVKCFDGNELFAVPNAFSPNDDGENDRFCLRGWDKCIQSFIIRIFDRWGELVFTADQPDFCWDGHFRGKILNADVYMYVISAGFTDGNDLKKSGNITLLR